MTHQYVHDVTGRLHANRLRAADRVFLSDLITMTARLIGSAESDAFTDEAQSPVENWLLAAVESLYDHQPGTARAIFVRFDGAEWGAGSAGQPDPELFSRSWRTNHQGRHDAADPDPDCPACPCGDLPVASAGS